MFLINDFKDIFSKALERFAKENEIGKSNNQILIFPDDASDEMVLQFTYCIDYSPVKQILWDDIYPNDFIMRRDMMMAQYFLQAFIRIAREYDCEPTQVAVMVVFENDESKELTLFVYRKNELIIDIETKRKKILELDELFMDA